MGNPFWKMICIHSGFSICWFAGGCPLVSSNVQAWKIIHRWGRQSFVGIMRVKRIIAYLVGGFSPPTIGWLYSVNNVYIILMVMIMVNDGLLAILVGGFNLPLWKMMEFVSWDDEIPKIWKIIKKSCSSHHQPGTNWPTNVCSFRVLNHSHSCWCPLYRNSTTPSCTNLKSHKVSGPPATIAILVYNFNN